jgi:hypothetical protein
VFVIPDLAWDKQYGTLSNMEKNVKALIFMIQGELEVSLRA